MRRSWQLTLGLAAAVVLGAAAGAYWLFTSTRLVQVLVMGTEGYKFSRHSDTMLLVTFRPSTKHVHILSIPRDTAVQGDTGVMKMGEVFARGWNRGGAEGAAQKVLEQLSSILKLPLRHYCILEYKGFERAVDELGGIDVNIPRAMDYDDKAGNLHIHLPAGPRHLNGEEALQFVRYRGDGMGDVGRIARQQMFLKAVKNQVSLEHVPAVVRAVERHVKTNLPMADVLRLANHMRKWKDINLTTATLPGELWMHNRLSFWRPDVRAVEALRARLLNL